MGLDWQAVIGHGSGSRLRISLVMPLPLREAIGGSSSKAEAWLRVLDGAELHLDRVEKNAWEISCSTRRGEADLSGVREAKGPTYRLTAAVRPDAVEGAPASARVFSVDAIALQAGGPGDFYLARDTSEGRLPFLRIVHENRSSVVVMLFTSAISRRLPTIAKALLPAQVRIATLTLLPDDVRPA